MSLLWTTVAVVMFIGLLIAHEAAHALVLRRLGIPISEAGLGLPVGPRIVLKPTKRRPFALSFSIWLFMAYVAPDPKHEERLNALSYRDKAWFSGAGIVANAMIATGLLSVILVLDGRWWRALLFAAITVALWVGRRLFVSYVVPAMAVPLVAFVAWTLFSSDGEPGGVIGTASLLVVSGPTAALQMISVMSLALAVLNMAPIYPFDGGRICGEVVRRWGGKRGEAVFQNVGIVVALSLLVYGVVSDIGWLIS